MTGNYTVLEDTSEEDETDEDAIQMWQVNDRNCSFLQLFFVFWTKSTMKSLAGVSVRSAVVRLCDIGFADPRLLHVLRHQLDKRVESARSPKETTIDPF